MKFYNIGPRSQCYNFFMSVIYKHMLWASEFVHGKLTQPNQKFVGKAGGYTSEAPFRCSIVE